VRRVALVWLVLRRYRFDAGNTPTDDVVSYFKDVHLDGMSSGLTNLVENVCDAADRGFDLKSYKLQIQFSRDPSEDPPSAATLSIQSQWSRLVFATHALLPDSLKESRRRFN
jgi:hypothetical protein